MSVRACVCVLCMCVHVCVHVCVCGYFYMGRGYCLYAHLCNVGLVCVHICFYMCACVCVCVRALRVCDFVCVIPCVCVGLALFILRDVEGDERCS